MGHSLNLAVQDTCRSVPVISEALDTVLELSKIFKYSAKKKSMLLQLKSELAPDSPGLKPLCPTRWTVRAESLLSVLTNYVVIQSVLEEIVDEYRGNAEATASARGVHAVMEKFSFLFGVTLAEKVFSLTDRLSRALQAKRVFAVEGKKYVALTVGSLKDLRSDTKFDDFWAGVKRNAEELDVNEPVMPRKRKAPRHFDPASSTHADNSPEDLYRRYYFEVIDNLIGEIERRFDSHSFELYGNMEDILLSAPKGELASCEDKVHDIVSHFSGDLEQSDLTKELALLKNVLSGSEITYDTLRAKVSEYRVFPQVLTLLRLLFVIPATSATSERSFSALRLVKTYLRSTMKQERLNHLMILHIHKDREINIMKAISEFVSRNSERVKLFGAP